MLVDQGHGSVPPLPWQIGAVAVGRHVHGVHRLPASVLTRVAAGKKCVGVSELLVDAIQEILGRRRGRRTSHDTRSYAGRVRKSVKSSLRHRSLINFLAGS